MALGIDVGGTHLRAALVDARGNIVRLVRRKLDDKDPKSLLDAMEAAKNDLDYGHQFVPMGLGIAGQIWLGNGVVALAPNLGWRDVPFGAMLEQRFGQPVRMVNDLNAIAFGESICGAGEGTQDMICVFVGTGVGMGAVAGGRVVEGADGMATELGHIKVDSVLTGRTCGCGERGCLEAYASGRHLPALVTAKHQEGLHSDWVASCQDDPKKLTADRIDEHAAAGDKACQALWIDIAEILGQAIGNTVTLFNPRVLVLGGGVLTSAPSLMTMVHTSIRRYAAASARVNLDVRSTTLVDNAGVIGSALLALSSKA
jgi:glucokinase